MQQFLRRVGLAVLLLASGCADKSTAPASGESAKAPAPAVVTNVPRTGLVPEWPPTKAQPRLQTMKLYIGAEVITAELALTQVQVGTGMMFRESMAENEGMLFVFAAPQRVSFYMRNTTVPLTAAYIDPDGTILELVDLHPKVEEPVEARSDNIQFVLEMNQGWFKRHNIGVGTVIGTERGKLRDTFRFGR